MAWATSVMRHIGIAIILTFSNILIVDSIADAFPATLFDFSVYIIFSIIVSLFATMAFPLALYATLEGLSEYWNFDSSDVARCCHMGGTSDEFAFIGMAQSFAPAAILTLVAVTQWLIWRSRVRNSRTLLIAVPIVMVWTGFEAVAYAHALQICAGCW